MSDSTARKLKGNVSGPAEFAWNRRILVVDDESEILRGYKDILTPTKSAPRVTSSRTTAQTIVPLRRSESEFELVTVGSVDEAIKAVEQSLRESRPFAMGFFDVRLGQGMDGVQLAREIRKLDPEIWAVFVTAYNDRTLNSIAAELGEGAGQWDYLNKPFNNNEIFQKAEIFTNLWNLKKERERQNQALSDLNRKILESERVTSVAAVARGVAHEFGNLLMHIIGRAEVSRGKSPDEMKLALEKIIEASQRASDILDRFNHLSDQKNTKAERQLLSLRSILDEALDLLGHRLKKESVHINVDGEDAPVMAHGTSVLQVFVNLLINACHALEPRADKQIYVSFGADKDAVSVTFRDNGPGAPAEIIDRLTEAFFTTKGEKGTGLGLAICREIVEIDHRGEFQISNSKLGGLQIAMSFPKGGGTDG